MPNVTSKFTLNESNSNEIKRKHVLFVSFVTHLPSQYIHFHLENQLKVVH